MGVMLWWKGLPAFIEAWEKRSGGIEARLQASMDATLVRYDDEIERCNAHLAQAEHHHRLCLDQQEVLRTRISEQDLIIATQNKTIAAQTNTIIEMAEQMKGLHLSNIQQQTELAERVKDKDYRL